MHCFQCFFLCELAVKSGDLYGRRGVWWLGAAALLGVAIAANAGGAVPILIVSDGLQAPIATRKGAPVVIAFEYAGGTGYSWLVQDPLPTGVRVASEDSQPSKPGVPGGTLRQAVTFVVDQAGEHRVMVAFRRPWLEPNDTDRRVILRFSVAE